ncbi:MAG: TIGR03086 family metal-binding protein [Gordonia paraffinivorans]
MTAPLATDPRPVYADAVAWVADLLHHVDPSRHADPTPCDELDVAALGGHLLGTANRAIAIAEGRDVLAVPAFGLPFDPEAYAAATSTAIARWADDALLDAMVAVPWGTVPGRGALWGYVNETLVHGWDLAVATGQPSEAPAGLAEATLPVARMFIGADIRDEAPFAAVVEPRSGAGPTERLANWSGRTSTPWLAPARI